MHTYTSNTLSRNLHLACVLKEYMYTYVWISLVPSHIYDMTQNLNHATLLKMTIESVCIHIVKMSHRAKVLVAIPNFNIQIRTYLLYMYCI